MEDINGKWIEEPPIKGTLIVNVASSLARWTDGAYKSTPHRVVNSSGRERLSLVLVFDPDPKAVVDAREVFGPGHNAGHPPVSYGDYLNWRFHIARTNDMNQSESVPFEGEIDLAIGSALRDLRESDNQTARQLAAQSGVSAAMISRIENGQASPSITTLGALANALNVPLVSLFREIASAHADFTHVVANEGLRSTCIVGGHGHELANLAFHTRRDLQFKARMVTLVRQSASPPTYLYRTWRRFCLCGQR